MSPYRNRSSATSDRRYTPLFAEPSCPSMPKRRTIDLPFGEEGDAALLPIILRDTPMCVPRSLAPLIYMPAPVHETTPKNSASYPPPGASHSVAGVILPAQMYARVTLSRHAHADTSARPAQRSQSPSPSRATRQEREGRRSSSRSSTLSSTGDTGNNTRRRTSDSSLSSSSSRN